MTKKQAFKMIARIEKQLDALNFYLAVSRIPEVKELLSTKYDFHDYKCLKKSIDSLRNDLLLTVLACKKDTI